MALTCNAANVPVNQLAERVADEVLAHLLDRRPCRLRLTLFIAEAKAAARADLRHVVKDEFDAFLAAPDGTASSALGGGGRNEQGRRPAAAGAAS